MGFISCCSKCGRKLASFLLRDGLCGKCAKANRYTTFECDYITGYDGDVPAKVSFGDGIKPGCFIIGDTEYPASFVSVEDLGICGENKYDRISTGQFIFYIKKGKGEFLYASLNAAREKCVRESCAQLEIKDYLNDYAEPASESFEATYIAGVEGVSKNYNHDTQSIISRLKKGDTLYLKLWPDAPYENYALCVFTTADEQIGYMSLPGTFSALDAEFRRQIEFGIPFTAKVHETGIVQNANIWWCNFTATYNVPYPKDSEMVYVTDFGRPYHSRKGCCKAEWEVPLSWVQKYDVRPCKRCHK